MPRILARVKVGVGGSYKPVSMVSNTIRTEDQWLQQDTKVYNSLVGGSRHTGSRKLTMAILADERKYTT